MTFFIVVLIIVAVIILVTAIGTRDQVRGLEAALEELNRRLDALPAQLARELRAFVPAAPAPATEPGASEAEPDVQTAPPVSSAPPAPPSPPSEAAQPSEVIAQEPRAAEVPDVPDVQPVHPAVAEPTPDAQPVHAAEPDTRRTSVPIVAAAGGEPPLPPAPPAAPPAGGGDAGSDLENFEKRFGTQWVVWIGGIALALGGIFLIRYSIEQGYFGPATRVMLGAALALALVGAGELTRRQEIRLGISGTASAHIPSILTAAGTTIAYATVYGAYALYEFLSPAAAFVLLGAVALATLAAALVHGPALAGLGLIGAYVTPLLVSTGQPNYWTLYVYLTVVTAAALALARFRLWRWLAITAIAFSLFWMFVGIHDLSTRSITAHAFYAVAGFLLSAIFIVAGFIVGPPNERDEIDPVSSGALAGFLLGAFTMVLTSRHDLIPMLTFAALVAGTVVIARRTASATLAMLVAAAFSVLVIGQWAISGRFVSWEPAGIDPALFNVRIEGMADHLLLAAFCAMLFGVGSVTVQGRFRREIVPIAWASAGVLTPIALLFALYYRVTDFAPSIPFAGVALLIAAFFAMATELLSKRDPRPGLAASTAIFASGAVAALALAFTFVLERGALTIALALMAPGIALVAEKRPLPILRKVVAVIVLLVLARVAWDPRIVGNDVGTTPIFNWLLYGYGIPALAFWTAGYILRKRADDFASRETDAAAILFTVLLFFLEIRHLIYGNIYHAGTGLAELALQVSTGLATTIGLERIRVRTGSIVHDYAARLIGGVAFAAIVLGLAIRHNPMLTGEPVGGPFFNLILLGYGLPAILMAVLARLYRRTRPHAVYVVAAVTAIILALVYLTLEVRTLFHGSVLTVGPTTDAEQYTYSAVWLAFGVALLLAGIALTSQPARLASAAVVILTTAKVFLYDLGGVQGVYRAFSFIGLGIVLIGIGLLYQRLLFPPRPRTGGDGDAEATAAAPSSA
jgi:uncharacterized membrane protein